jgi:hypothetical protein
MNNPLLSLPPTIIKYFEDQLSIYSNKYISYCRKFNAKKKLIEHQNNGTFPKSIAIKNPLQQSLAIKDTDEAKQCMTIMNKHYVTLQQNALSVLIRQAEHTEKTFHSIANDFKTEIILYVQTFFFNTIETTELMNNNNDKLESKDFSRAIIEKKSDFTLTTIYLKFEEEMISKFSITEFHCISQLTNRNLKHQAKQNEKVAIQDVIMGDNNQELVSTLIRRYIAPLKKEIKALNSSCKEKSGPLQRKNQTGKNQKGLEKADESGKGKSYKKSKGQKKKGKNSKVQIQKTK